MLSEDYIMRMINQALAALMIALGLRKAGKYDDALQSLDQALEGLLGLKPHILDQLDDGTLINEVSARGEHSAARLGVLGDIYREKSELYNLKGQPNTSLQAARRSLRLYLEAALVDEAGFTPELAQKIEALRNLLTAPNLPVETRLALLDYLERLLAQSDRFLAQAGLSQPELQKAFDSLNNIDPV
jgi:tetratricopeptide (TPR) repeat protein